MWRGCAATRTTLHLIEPFGFKLDDAALKRGMDYWQHVTWQRWVSWTAFAEKLPAGARGLVCRVIRAAALPDVKFAPDDYLVFGRGNGRFAAATAGAKSRALAAHSDVQSRGAFAESVQLCGAGVIRGIAAARFCGRRIKR